MGYLKRVFAFGVALVLLTAPSLLSAQNIGPTIDPETGEVGPGFEVEPNIGPTIDPETGEIGPGFEVENNNLGACDSLICPNQTIGQNLERLYEISVPIILTLAFLVVLYAGYLYITSLGRPDAVNEAKNWFVAALVGSALILLLPLIIDFLGTPSG